MSSDAPATENPADRADEPTDGTADENPTTPTSDVETGTELTGKQTANAGACPVVDTIEQIGSEWRLVVLHDLQDGEKRFNELKRSTDASSRTLSRVLDDLADLDLVERRVESDAPIATYYSLTEKGAALCPVFDEIEAWASEYVDACTK